MKARIVSSLCFAVCLAVSGLPAMSRAATPLPAPDLTIDPEVAQDIASAILAASQDRATRMTVPVMINGQGPFQFVVDTGSERTAVAADLVERLALPKGKPVLMHAANISERRETAAIRNLQVGSSSGLKAEAIVLSREHILVDGMLGIDLMRKQQIVMDFKGAKLSVEPAKKERFDINAVVVPGRSLYGQLILADVKIRGQPIYVVLDSGGETTVANSALGRMLSRANPNDATVGIIDVTGLQANARAATLPDVFLGGIVIRNLQVAFADLAIFERLKLTDRPAMLLGMDVLRKFDRVAVNFERKQAAFNVAAGTPTFTAQ
jgi:predicted aspartyl protease